MRNENLMKDVALGAAAGLAGTMVINALNAAGHKWLPQAEPPMREDPGDFMVRRAERLLPEQAKQRIPRTAEKVASNSLAMGYGMTFGALYSTLRPKGGSVLIDGAALGLACWAAGYLGWLPATGLM